ncbi:AraC family transcriptional regulator [Bacterioplanoides sp. SCSIO 12839]|uniref:AraC family transcriptional regulator n=1 Tax=Bacterioplanoides sp. SCSIO 12839 TaxID=2829569 RepID=UPI002101EECA|nr:AraC family transcriptional regulator [Bacterioplanoides sp. SCSIO 12839]UTW48894.1 AraC family transcriptional regulator [Bacterioplanoides sp. SCSIO 12839]
MDILSSILRHIHLRGSVYFNSCFCSPWGLDIDRDQRASFHIIERGQCWLQLNDEDPVPLVTGDIVILPHGSKHQIFDQRSSTLIPGATAVEQIISGNNPFSGEHEHFNIVCGYFEYDRNIQNQFIDSLPEVIHITQQQRLQFRFLHSALEMIATESASQKPGSELLKDKITELLFIQVMRTFIQLNPQKNNFIAALNDRHISVALGLMHTQPETHWTLHELAKHSGMSRSRFAQHFHDLVGTTAMRYLLSCRMQRAKQYIEETSTPVNNLAELVGYSSDSAFKKAFKQFFGHTPAHFRKQTASKPPELTS